MGTVSHGSNDWLIDSGASKHMMRFKELFMKLYEHDSPHKMKLGDDYQYLIKGSGESSYGVCKGCAKGKNTKKNFLSSESKEKGILEIIHSDVCGPMSSSSLSGYVYYVYFIDDFSRKTSIYFLKNKDEVFSKFK